MHLRFGGNDVTQQRLCAFNVDGEIVVNEEHCDLALFFAGASLQQQQFIHHTLVGAEANRISKKSCDGAELAAVWAASPGFTGDNAKRSPSFTDLLERGGEGLRHQIELL